jgi:hypothetical protein
MYECEHCGQREDDCDVRCNDNESGEHNFTITDRLLVYNFTKEHLEKVKSVTKVTMNMLKLKYGRKIMMELEGAYLCDDIDEEAGKYDELLKKYKLDNEPLLNHMMSRWYMGWQIKEYLESNERCTFWAELY